MQKIYNPSTRAKITLDFLFISLICVFLQNGFKVPSNEFLSSTHVLLTCITTGCWFFCGRAMGLYKDYRATPFSYEWIVFLKTMIIYFLLTSFIFSQLVSAYRFGLSQLAFHCAWIFVLLPVQKLAIRVFFKRLRNSKQVRRKVLIVGAGDSGVNFYQQYVKDNHYGYALTGFIDDTTNPLVNGHYLGKTADIDEIIANYELDDIVVAMPINDDIQLSKIIKAGEREGKRVKIIPHYQRFSAGRIHVGTLGSLPIITLRSLPLDVTDNKVYKRSFDIIFAGLVTILILSWLIPIISLAIKFTSKGPVFFKQERWGLNNKPIVCYKFRTMVHNSRDLDESGKYQQAKKNDPRITKIGAFLRKTSLDEMPQFLNVLLGSMSVVGPRPHPVPLNIQSKDSVENYMMRHWVKPGITGWAQTNGYRGETRKPYLMQKRVEFDVWYMENWTFWLDLQIILQTLVNMVKTEKNAY
ncbi:undecaprenyl-phosphate glucose phosphotransferase [Terrimonas sp. NA20]|uniref:Undecaprenyl-phosphate glucose phosphotransferase n=1 Tax=Terrimonas ginsenosidimutans TaxID=2908004 RepID=A0ABS9KUX0_9BACT|nr:undecaprenyl-phosphate glucose phosphotransferase [Terrimonas ginsenosidimutans]MCG2616082.1 undecaprenyl-phosphate glucose phosphotransferase [Terrimonas ginsenosidimutans]